MYNESDINKPVGTVITPVLCQEQPCRDFLLGILIYYILCEDISVIKQWIRMIPVKWYDIISLSEMIIYHFTGLNCPIK